MGAAYVYHYYILFISIISILMIYITLNGWDSGSVGWREKMVLITLLEPRTCVWTCLRFIISGHYSYTSTVTTFKPDVFVHIMYSTIRTMHKRYVCTYVDKYLYMQKTNNKMSSRETPSFANLHMIGPFPLGMVKKQRGKHAPYQ